MEGNQAALGLKLLQQPKQRDAVARAIESRNTVVAGPVELVQGGTAFISRTPIFLPFPASLPAAALTGDWQPSSWTRTPSSRKPA
jgi:sensor domain CHASE-containing protein